MPTARVLVVDHLPQARLLVEQALQREGMVVDQAEDGPSALAHVAGTVPDLVLVDSDMPGMSGLEMIACLRRHDADVPVILLADHAAETHCVLALDLGADDYVAKPFGGRELAARARSVLRRSRHRRPPSERIVAGPVEILVAERRVLRHGAAVELTAKEFDLLAFLAGSPPARVFSRTELLAQVWGSSPEWQDAATVTEHVRRLRLKIEADPARPALIQTVRGVGYRFDPAGVPA